MSDTQAPALTGLTLPSVINLGGGDTTITYSASASDNVGVASVWITFDRQIVGSAGPTATWLMREEFGEDFTASPISRDLLISASNTSGPVSVVDVTVYDDAGNTTSYSAAELQGLGVSTGFTLSAATPDTTAPELTGLTLPGAVDVTNGTVATTYSVSASDDRAVDGVWLTFERPASGTNPAANRWFVYEEAGEDWASGALTRTIDIRADTVPGNVVLYSVSVSDAAGNVSVYDRPDLIGLGLPLEFEVENTAVIAGFAISAEVTGGDLVLSVEREGASLAAPLLGLVLRIDSAGAGTPVTSLDATGTFEETIEIEGQAHVLRVMADITATVDTGETVLSVTIPVDAGAEVDISVLGIEVDGVLSVLPDPPRVLAGGTGNDMLAFAGPEPAKLLGGAGDDMINGGLGDDLIRGDEGSDTASFADATGGVSVSLGTSATNTSSGADGNDELSDIEVLVGSAYADVLSYIREISGPGPLAEGLYGGAGSDELVFGVLGATAGATMVDGGSGDDEIVFAGQGALAAGSVFLGHVDGGAGTDLLDLSQEQFTGMRLELGSQTLRFLSASPDISELRGIENATGTQMGDEIIGSDAANVLDGAGGDDTLDARGGADTLTGGGGADIFVVAPGYATITITDFEDGSDLLDLTAFARADALDALANLPAGTPILTFADGTEVTLAGLTAGQISADDARLAAALPSDLVARNVSVSEATVLTGQSFDVTYQIVNIGAGPTAATETRAGIYLSPNPTVLAGGNDILIGAQPSSTSSAPGAVDLELETVTVPFGLAPGTYYLGVFADDLRVEAEADEDNNSSSGPEADPADWVTITVTAAPYQPPYDFTGDGTSDVLWRDTNTGRIGYWEMDEGARAWNQINTVSQDWAVVGTGDVDGNGEADILWRNDTSGAIGFYGLESGSYTWNPLTTVSLNWKVVGAGNFDGSGDDDVLWRDTNTGRVGYYEMNGGAFSFINLTTVSLNWKVVGAGDFDGDGDDDILWRDTNSGRIGYYEMNGSAFAWRELATVTLDWKVVATGDFNGDGEVDMLWQNTQNGRNGYWEMTGGSYTWIEIASTAAKWQVAAAGDYDSNGADDILWRDTDSGRIGYWDVDGSAVSWTELGTVGLNWDTVGPAPSDPWWG